MDFQLQRGDKMDELKRLDPITLYKGATTVDLSGFWSKEELVAMTNADVDAITNS